MWKPPRSACSAGCAGSSAQPTPLREHLEAAVENDDPAEARRFVERFEFSDAQRRNVEQLLDAWERTLGRTGR